MILPDSNILIHAHNLDFPRHAEARDWWEFTLNSPRPVGLSWATMLGFIRIMTHRRILPHPIFPVDALHRVRGWLSLPHVQILNPGELHASILFGLLEELGTAGDLTTDAHLAALAIEYKGEIASTDNDFTRFSGLRWFNPLQLSQPKKQSPKL